MIAEIIASALVATSPAPTASPAQQLSAPVREVVYKVSMSDRSDDITESYGGGPDVPLPSSTSMAAGHGTVTVDVIAKFEDGVLDVKIAELWSANPLLMRFAEAVAPDGTVEFASATITPVTIERLPYFAMRFTPEGKLVVGTHWTVNKTVGRTSVVTDYALTAVGSDSVTLIKT